MTTILFSIPCFHDSKYYTSNVASCKFIIDSDNVKYHVIHLRDPIYYDDVQQFSSVTYHVTKYNYIDELWEKVSLIPISSLYNIDKLSNLSVIVELSGQMVSALCSLIQENLYYQNTPKGTNCIPFLQSTTAFTFDEVDQKPRFIHLNRFQIKNANLMPALQKKRKLLAQASIIPSLILSIFFSKSKKSSSKTIVKCSEVCKLMLLTPRFVKFNEDPICEVFHEIYCNSKNTKFDMLENLTLLFPNNRTDIIDTLKHFGNL
ncbi:hypothetical protein CsNV_092 [Callinectes sapidus nudivirus]|nr:hypothetical protein CsNV_092 [Callinectes sapidus nudivirus]